ncbi:hypothetical protein EAG_14925 [Camponotus floridanus]|uniref:Uncharacterized protein n=1 Tax=Camponotus floridanus TaxID=104421 RepID=E2AML4_CAMFO|nr:hypothetical protein EAG_14925 [Camponotus floridanus]
MYNDRIFREDGLYDILSRRDMLDEELPEAAELKCTLDIPKTNYRMTTTTSSVTTIPEHKMDIQDLDSSKSGNGGGKINRKFC